MSCAGCDAKDPSKCDGPCYDLCSCDHCWNGWKTFSFWQRLKWRIAYLFEEFFR